MPRVFEYRRESGARLFTGWRDFTKRDEILTLMAVRGCQVRTLLADASEIKCSIDVLMALYQYATDSVLTVYEVFFMIFSGMS